MGKNSEIKNIQKFQVDSLHVCRLAYCTQTSFQDFNQAKNNNNSYIPDEIVVCRKIGPKQFRRATTGEVYNILDMYNTMGEKVIAKSYPFRLTLKELAPEFNFIFDKAVEIDRETIKTFEDKANGKYVKKEIDCEKLWEECRIIRENLPEEKLEEQRFEVDGRSASDDPNWGRNIKIIEASIKYLNRKKKEKFLQEAGIPYDPNDLIEPDFS